MRRLPPYLPGQRGNGRISNLQMLNALLSMAENGCKWRSWPTRFGKWSTIHKRMSRWSKNGVWERVFERLKTQRNISPEALSIDSASVKVHPDGTGALKKRPAIQWKIQWRLEYKNTYDCFRGSPCGEVRFIAQPSARRA